MGSAFRYNPTHEPDCVPVNLKMSDPRICFKNAV